MKRAQEETEKPRSQRSKSAGSAKGEPYTAILALTRDPLARDLLAELAMERGYGLCGAVSGTQAVRVLSSEPPALVIVDLDIPDGRSLVKAMSADDRWSSIPIIALAGPSETPVETTSEALVFSKPELQGLEEAVVARFEPDATEPKRGKVRSAWADRIRTATSH